MTIRDLGYKAYDGPRLPPRKRYGVLIGRSLALAWQPGLVKATMIVGMLPLLICAVVMYFKLKAQQIMSMQGVPVQFADAGNMVYYCMYWCQLWFGFSIGLLCAAPAVAEDVATGAFQFYFARPITPRHYAAGKLVSSGLLALLVVGAPGLLLALMRLGMARDGAEALKLLPLLLSTIAFALLSTATFVLPALALSVLVRRGGYAQGAWAALFFLPWVLGESMAVAASVPGLALVSLPTVLRLTGQMLFGISPSYDLPVMLPVIVLVSVLAISTYVIFRRLSRVEVFS